MICAWQELLHILPPWLRSETDPLGKNDLQELRLRTGQPPELICGSRSHVLSRMICADDINYVVNCASRYSPWTAATISQGYLTAVGGHRIGVCGEAVVNSGKLAGIRNVRSLCIRVARDFPGLADGIPEGCSVLIIGSPGSGKTTLLRDLIRQRSDTGPGSISVIDERGELFPDNFPTGPRTDILSGCPKSDGIPLALRTMGPAAIAVDEITEESDARALCGAAWCGVELLATAHARSLTELKRRPVYQSLIGSGIFQLLVTLREDKSWRTERINL